MTLRKEKGSKAREFVAYLVLYNCCQTLSHQAISLPSLLPFLLLPSPPLLCGNVDFVVDSSLPAALHHLQP